MTYMDLLLDILKEKLEEIQDMKMTITIALALGFVMGWILKGETA